jgi:hypothetical protein
MIGFPSESDFPLFAKSSALHTDFAQEASLSGIVRLGHTLVVSLAHDAGPASLQHTFAAPFVKTKSSPVHSSVVHEVVFFESSNSARQKVATEDVQARLFWMPSSHVHVAAARHTPVRSRGVIVRNISRGNGYVSDLWPSIKRKFIRSTVFPSDWWKNKVLDLGIPRNAHF